MIGRIYVNKITDKATAIDFSQWPGQILDKEKTPEGFAYHKVLDILGIRSEVVDASRTMLLAGDTVAIKERAGALRRQIGIIARYGAEKDTSLYRAITRDQLGRHLGRIADWLRDLPEETPFSVVATAVTTPFARDANDPKELFHVLTGTPWWLSQSSLEERWEHAQLFANRTPGQEQ